MARTFKYEAASLIIASGVLVAAGSCNPCGTIGGSFIVDVDERSLSAIGQWPWRRDLIGRLVARVREMGASTVALDVIFADARTASRLANIERNAVADTVDRRRYTLRSAPEGVAGSNMP